MADEQSNDDKATVFFAQESLAALAAQKLDAKNYSGALKLAALCQSLGPHFLALEIIRACHDGPTLKTNRHRPALVALAPRNDKGKDEADAPSSHRVAARSKSEPLPDGSEAAMHHVLRCDDLFAMLGCVFWDEPEEIEGKFKTAAVLIHPDRNQNSAQSISAFAKLNSEFTELKRNPVKYTMRLQIAAVKAGQASEFDLPRPEEKISYGKSCQWGVEDGFSSNGKRGYTWSAMAGGGEKKHVDMNPAAEEGMETDPSQLYAGGGDASNWLAPLSYSSTTAHRFDHNGQYQSFTTTGAAIARNGTRFDAKNN